MVCGERWGCKRGTGGWVSGFARLVSLRQRWRSRGEQRAAAQPRSEKKERQRAERRKKQAKRNTTKQHDEFFRKSAVEGKNWNRQLLAIKSLESVKSPACTLGPLSCGNKGTQTHSWASAPQTHTGVKVIAESMTLVLLKARL